MPASSVEDIRSQMARIRMRAHRKAEKLGEETRHFLDWKHYVRLFPWAAVGLAAVVGYWIVPKRNRTATADAKLLQELAKKNSVVVAPVPMAAAAVRKPGFLDELGSTVRIAFLKAGLAYAGRYLAQAIAAGTAQTSAPSVGTASSTTTQRRTPYGAFGTGDEARSHEPAAPRPR